MLENQEAIEGLLKIKNKRGHRVPFIFNQAQRYYWKRRTRRNLILKARQKGITKVIDADQLIDCIRKPTNAVVISHESGSTKRLFEAVKFYVESLTVKPVISIDNAQTMTFPKRGSTYFIGTAGQRAFGRGDTVDRAHLSEAAFYYDLKRSLAGISEAAEYGQIDIETTANGRGNGFYEMWQNAKNGQSPYTPIFIPWFIDHEYSADSMTPEEKAGLSAAVIELFATPDKELTLTDEEKNFMARMKAEWNMDATIGQVKWRRYKMWDLGDTFFQEYPEDDISCFLQSGRPVFRAVTLRPEFKIDLEARMSDERVAELKKKNLFGGIDAAEGTEGGDAHCFSVLDLSESPGKVIFEICSNDPIEVFAGQVAAICKRFGIRLAVEKNGVGVAMCLALKRLGCPHKEWSTTATTRPIMVTDLEQAYRKGELIETYAEAQNEALDMLYDENNRPEHPKGKHDDRVFSRAVALQRSKMPTPRLTMIG